MSDINALRDILQDKEVMYAYEHGFSDEEVMHIKMMVSVF